MEIKQTLIPDLYVIQPRVFQDDRGYFFESHNEFKFEQHHLNYKFVQDNESKSTYGVLRGLHYQVAPFSQAKLVRASVGKVLDVVVDIRPNSKTYGKHFSIILSEENKSQLLIPKGFAHGFVVLSEVAIFSYKCDQFYSADHDSGIIYNDENLNIDWMIPATDIILSEKDKVHPRFGEHRS